MEANAKPKPKPKPKPKAPINRRISNELGASLQIEQLRTLQHQLSNIIQDSRETARYDEGSTGSIDDSTRSAPTRTDSIKRPSRISWASQNISEYEFDIESGMPSLFTGSNYGHRPQRPQKSQPMSSSSLPKVEGEDEDARPITYRTGSGRNVVQEPRSKKSSLLTSSSLPEEENEDAPPITYHIGSGRTVAQDTPPLAAAPSIYETPIADDVQFAITTGSTGSTGGSVSSGGNPTADTGMRRRRSRFRRFSRKSSRSSSPSSSRSPSRGRSSKAASRLSSVFKMNTDFQSETRKKAIKPPEQLPTYDFLEAEERSEGRGLRPGAKWWHGVFLFSFVSMLACIITLWAPYPIGARMPSATIATMPWSDGCQGLKSCICPRETICADDVLSLIFLTIARSTAWFDYPLYMLLFMSKANNLNNFLQSTALRCWINFSDSHRVHSLFGMIVGLESTTHSFFHILRWARRQDDIQLLVTSGTGITGLIAIILCPFIVLPMTVPYLKKKMKYEWRKSLHYLFLVWGAALMCHAPQRIFWLIGVPFFIYLADKMVEFLHKTHLVESAHFQRLGETSCIISFENPPGFGRQNSAYLYLMLPWLSKGQFHAFTVFPCTKPGHSSVCIHKCGDWTNQLMKTIVTPTHKPAFVVGPFLSPFSSPAMDSEFLVAVASGIGVTPAISLIKQYSNTSRRLNLVWICRDAGLVEHFLQNVEFGSDGYTLIYYTGKERSVILRDDLPSNVFIFNGRPNLERTISGIISSIATGEGLPEELQNKVLTQTPAQTRTKLLLEKALSIYTMDQLYEYTVKASNYHNKDLEHLGGRVNYQGVLSTMKHLLGDDSQLVTDYITSNFEKIDTNGDCQLDRDEFGSFLVLMAEKSDNQEETTIATVKQGLQREQTVRDMFESSKKGSVKNFGPGFGIKEYLKGDGKFSARNWNMLYCGGSQPVLDQLKAFKKKFGVGLSVEKFDW